MGNQYLSQQMATQNHEITLLRSLLGISTDQLCVSNKKVAAERVPGSAATELMTRIQKTLSAVKDAEFEADGSSAIHKRDLEILHESERLCHERDAPPRVSVLSWTGTGDSRIITQIGHVSEQLSMAIGSYSLAQPEFEPDQPVFDQSEPRQ